MKTIIIDIVYLSYNLQLTIVVWLKQIEKKNYYKKIICRLFVFHHN